MMQLSHMREDKQNGQNGENTKEQHKMKVAAL